MSRRTGDPARSTSAGMPNSWPSRGPSRDHSGRDLDRTSPPRQPTARTGRCGRAAPVAAGVVGGVLVVGSLLPFSGHRQLDGRQRGARRGSRWPSPPARAEIDRLLEALGADPENPDTLSDLADAYLAGSTGDDLARAAAALPGADRAGAGPCRRLRAAHWCVFAGGRLRGRPGALLDSYRKRETADPVEVAFFDGLIALSGENDRRARGRLRSIPRALPRTTRE
jgi:hypothetical protein